MIPKFFGQFLLERGFITEEQLLDALQYQQNRIMRIGEIAVELKLMTKEQVEMVNREQRKSDLLFGELAIKMDFLTADQLERIVTIQQNNHIYLGQTIVEKGYLSQNQMQRLLDEFHEEQKRFWSLGDIVPDRLEIRNELVAILDVTIKIFRRMANMYLKLGKGYFKSQKVENLYLMTFIDFSGSLGINYFVNLPLNVAHAIAQNLYGDEKIELSDTIICDCVGELLNVICGNAYSQLLELGRNAPIHPPRHFLWHQMEAIIPKDARHVLVFPGKVPTDYLEVGIIWNKPENP